MFFCWGWSDLDKISVTGAEWPVDCCNVVEIAIRCRILIWRTFGRIEWHVIPEPPAILQCAATWRIQCHDSRATCHISGCCHRVYSMACHPRATYHIVGCCHLVNSLSRFHSQLATCHDRAKLQGVRIPSAILKIVFRIFYFFLMQFRLWRTAAFVSSPIHWFTYHYNHSIYAKHPVTR